MTALEKTHLLPNGTAMYTAWGRDNTGPFFVADVQQIYAMLRKQYPNARVFASTFDRFLAAAEPQLHQLPVLTSDIGSTWVHGVGSAPQKHRLYREVFRRRADCIARGACDPTEASFVRFDRLLLKVSEHTSGADISVYYNVGRGKETIHNFSHLSSHHLSLSLSHSPPSPPPRP